MISLYWCTDFCNCRVTEQILQAMGKPSPESVTFRLHFAFLQTAHQRLRKAGNKNGRAATTIAEHGQRHLAGGCHSLTRDLNVHGSREAEKQEKGEEASD